MREDNLCGIQIKYGEEFLSEVCATYPRRIWNFGGNFYERSLTLTCPIVAVQVLLPNEPMKFETVQFSEKVHSNFGKIMIFNKTLPPEIVKIFLLIQETSITVLQERSLTIDQRLLNLGLYFDKLDELFKSKKINEFSTINALYKDSTFLQAQSDKFSQLIQFDVSEHIKIMFGVLEELYGKKSEFSRDKDFVDAVSNTFQIQADENNKVSVKDLAEKYLEFNTTIKDFSNYYSTIFENYLVNEFFINLHPSKFKGSIIYNYGVFLAIYKLLELVTFSMSIEYFRKEKKPLNKLDLILNVMNYSLMIDHNENYLNKISEYLKGRNDVIEIMQSMLHI